MLGNNLGVHVIQNPAGSWSFVGSGIPGHLCYVQADGSPATADQLDAAAHCGPSIAGVKSRTFTSEAAAQAALKAS